MSSAYFSNFPLIYYNGKVARNILLKAHFFANVISNYSAFYPFVIQGDIKPQQVAEKYYGNPDYDWLVWFSCQTFDPYYEWPLNHQEFYDYLLGKYGTIETAQSTIIHYVYNPSVEQADIEQTYRQTYTMSPTTFSFLSPFDKGFWTPVYADVYEDQINNDRRQIRLLDSDLLSQVNIEIGKIF